ncbi:MAG: hypothetical protein AAF490_16270 [Chloroflexota bacterium]
MKHPGKIRVVEPFITLGLFAVMVFYLINALNTGNWWWFRAETVHVRPSRIVIIDHGQRTIISAGHPDYMSLADALESSLAKLNNTDLVNVGLSEQTLSDYDEKSLVLELYFDKPVVFNTMARTGEPTQLLIPIDGRHANGNYVFRGAQGEWWYGAVRMADAGPLMSTLQNMGYQNAVVVGQR